VSAEARVQGRGVWETLIFCVGGLVFTVIGIQLGELAPTLWRGKDPGLLRAAVLVSLTIVGVRLCTVFLGNYLPRLGGQRRSAEEQRPSWRSLVVLSWAGLRGGDTLVMVLGVPLLTASGAPFSGRETLTAIAIGVVGVTLIALVILRSFYGHVSSVIFRDWRADSVVLAGAAGLMLLRSFFEVEILGPYFTASFVVYYSLFKLREVPAVLPQRSWIAIQEAKPKMAERTQ